MRRVLAKCSNCGYIAVRNKGRSGIPHVIRTEYCGTMHVIEWL